MRPRRGNNFVIIRTYHRKVYAVGQKDLIMLQPTDNKQDEPGLKFYNCVNRVGCTINKEGEMRLYVPMEIENPELVIENIMQLTLKLDVKSLEVAKYENIKDMYHWDKVLTNFNLMLEKSK